MKRLTQSGPETDVAGELVDKLIKESADLDALKKEGLAIAEKYGSTNSRWVRGPNDMEQFFMEVGEDIFLMIR